MQDKHSTQSFKTLDQKKQEAWAEWQDACERVYNSSMFRGRHEFNVLMSTEINMTIEKMISLGVKPQGVSL